MTVILFIHVFLGLGLRKVTVMLSLLKQRLPSGQGGSTFAFSILVLLSEYVRPALTPWHFQFHTNIPLVPPPSVHTSSYPPTTSSHYKRHFNSKPTFGDIGHLCMCRSNLIGQTYYSCFSWVLFSFQKPLKFQYLLAILGENTDEDSVYNFPPNCFP